MKKVRTFFVATALLLVTAGVFAGKARFTDVGVYAINGSTTVQLAPSYVTANLTTAFVTGDHQATINDINNVFYNVYTYDNVAKVFVPLYSTLLW
jgi:hypothetical protein